MLYALAAARVSADIGERNCRNVQHRTWSKSCRLRGTVNYVVVVAVVVVVLDLYKRQCFSYQGRSPPNAVRDEAVQCDAVTHRCNAMRGNAAQRPAPFLQYVLVARAR